MPHPPFFTRSFYQIFFGTPMGGLPSAPLPISLPNDQNLQPGDRAEIWYCDAAPFPGVPAGWRLAGEGTASEDGLLILPGNSRFQFPRQPDGTFANTTHPRFAGAVLRAEAGGAHTLRFKDGSTWRFASGPMGSRARWRTRWGSRPGLSGMHGDWRSPPPIPWAA